MSEPCFSCGAEAPSADGPTHRYMLSSAGCWAAFGEVLAREYSSARYMKNHRLTVDAYAVQHPGEASRQSLRSVCMHLCRLYAVLECDLIEKQQNPLMQGLANREDFYWLEPPDILGVVTVADVWATTGAEAHLTAVEDWARSAWEAWADYHDVVRSWVNE